jgi:hypothetical protein
MNRRFTDDYEELAKRSQLIAVAFSVRPGPQGAISGWFFRGLVPLGECTGSGQLNHGSVGLLLLAYYIPLIPCVLVHRYLRRNGGLNKHSC